MSPLDKEVVRRKLAIIQRAVLASLGAIDAALAADLAPAAGLRNRLVHEYDEIDDAIVHRSIPKAIDLLPRFVAQIDSYLSARP